MTLLYLEKLREAKADYDDDLVQQKSSNDLPHVMTAFRSCSVRHRHHR